MGMESTGYGVMPVYEVNKCCNDGYGMQGFGGYWIWIFLLLFLMNGANRGTDSAAFQGVMTRADMFEGFNFNDLQRQMEGLKSGLCDGFYTTNTNMLQGFNGVSSQLCNGFNSVNTAINQARFDAQQCCCETNRNIDALRYEASRNACDIVNAIREDGNATRALINQNEIQSLRDRLADKDREVMTANFQLSQQAQSANIIETLQPTSKPAYITCSPYQSAMIPFMGFGGFGNNCGCGCGCC